MHGADSAMSAHAATYNPVADREGREVYNRMYQRSEFPLSFSRRCCAETSANMAGSAQGAQGHICALRR